MTEKIKDFVEHELKMLDKGIVATPKRLCRRVKNLRKGFVNSKLITEVMITY